MALVVKDRVKVTSTTTGTGTFTLGSAVLGFQDFSVIGDGNTTYYTIAGVGTSEFEVGIGTYTASGTTLSRDTILESSNSGNAVNFSAGSKEVFVTYPAERSVYTDGAGTAITPATASRLGFANLAQGSALSVLGVTGNATADNASIAAGTDNQVLRRSGTAVGFGAVNLASTDAVTGDLPFSNLTQIAGLSVLGVTGNSTADVAGITAGTDNQVLRRSGTSVGFGAVNLASSDAVTGDLPFSNLAQGSALSVLGVTGNATADNASIAAGTDNQVLRRSGTSVAFGAVNLASTDAVTGDLPFSNLAQGSALSVLGVTGNATADNASIAAGTDHQVLRRSGTSVAFGSVNLAQSAAITGTLPVTNGGTGITSFGTGVATWLGTPSSANLAAAVTDETGSGSLVFATSPTLTTPVLGTPTSGNLSNCTVDGTNAVGYRKLPAVGTKTAGYTLATGDVGKYVQVGSGGAITIPDATFAEGDIISIFNNTSGNITITCSITTAYISGTDSDKATMTLATRGVATVLFISSTVCVVSGNVT